MSTVGATNSLGSTVCAQLCETCSLLEDVHKLSGPASASSILNYYLNTSFSVQDTWPQLPWLLQSAASGCDFCKVLHASLLAAPNLQAWRAEGNVTLVCSVIPDVYHRTRKLGALWVAKTALERRTVFGFVARLIDPDAGLVRQAKFLTCVETANPAEPFLTAPTAEPLSAANVSFMQDALAACDQNCGDSAGDRYVPTRLLDLGTMATEGGESGLRLVSKDELIKVNPALDKYAALSYCWGKAQLQSKTTTANLSHHLQGIEAHVLSPVIKDAIKVCQKLSIRYLWVDALCIVQGTDAEAIQDWNHESQQMCKVFAHAFVTICGASSESCQDGFLTTRQVTPVLSVRSRAADGSSAAPTYNIIPCASDAVDPKYYEGPRASLPGPFHGQIIDSKWYSRGWVHQEITFSRRLIMFGSHSIIFSCSGFTACENDWHQQHSSSTVSSYLPLTGAHNQAMIDKPYNFFAEQIREFSSKDFTIQADRLPALAGLAMQVAGIVKDDQYVAGLWRKNLAQDLLWSVDEHDRHMSFRERIASLSETAAMSRPSWSWAGMPGRCWPGALPSAAKSINLKCTVLKFEAEANGPQRNPFGRMPHAFIQLQAWTIPLAMFIGNEEPRQASARRALAGDKYDAVGLRRILWDTDNRHVADDITAKVQLVHVSASPEREACGLFVYPAENRPSLDDIYDRFYRIGVWRTSRGGDSLLGLDIPDKWTLRTITLL